jgi:hypothetical protein
MLSDKGLKAKQNADALILGNKQNVGVYRNNHTKMKLGLLHASEKEMTKIPQQVDLH